MSIALLLELAAESFGDRVAVEWDDGRLTYAALRERAARAADTLGDLGPGPIGYLGDTGPGLPVALFAAAWAGRPFVALNHRLPPASLRTAVDDLGRGAVVVVGPGAPSPAPAGPATLGVGRLLEPADTGSAVAPPAEVDPDRPAVELFTSGTGGRPKRAILLHEHLFTYVTATVDLGAAEGERLLLATPPFHIAAITAVLTACFAGRTIVALGRFTPRAWLDAVDRHAVTHAFVVPTMLARILDELDGPPERPAPALRHLAYGGARAPRPVVERALARFPDTALVNAYGLTETSSTITLLGPEDHDRARAGDPEARRRLDSVGRPLPGVEVCVVGPDGADVPAGEVGEVLVRGPQVSGRYAGRAAATRDGGWLPTGDVGRLDAAGYLYLGGRADDVIIKGAENLSPGEIEDALLAHPGVTAAAVVGVPHPTWGEDIGAAVVAAPGRAPDGDDLRAWVRDRLGSFKTPAVVELVDALPETPTGKVRRRDLRRALTSGAGAP